jgi:hypothetical protein
VSVTVLIASPEHLPALKEREDLSGAQAFSDADALRALDVITRQRASVVALERLFAASSRGAALINRIKADPSLSGCEIRVVAHDTAYSRVTRPAQPAGGASPVSPAPAPAPSTAPAAVAEAPAPAAAPLDKKGTRRAPRHRIVEGVEVMIDGNPAALVDLSLVGAQVVSPTILKPNQRIRISIADGPRPVRFSAAVAWASFEIPKGTPRYRAGVEFFDADTAALTRFIENKKQ